MFSFLSSNEKISLPDHNCVLSHALQLPALKKLVGKRVILASASPRRRDILQTFVGTVASRGFVGLLTACWATGSLAGDRTVNIRGDAPGQFV